MSLKISKDYFSQITPPELVLCKANRERVGTIFVTEISYERNFDNLDKITFTTPLYINGTIKNETYDLLDLMKFVEAIDLGVFYIDSINITSEGTHDEKKQITITSREGLLAQKYLDTFYVNTGETQDVVTDENEVISGTVPSTQVDQVIFYNPNDHKLSLLHLALEEKFPDWTIRHVDFSLWEKIGRFEIDRQDIYSFLVNDVAQYFSCFFVFDTIDMNIDVYAEDIYGIDTNIFVSYDNLLKDTNISCDLSNIKTCLTVTGDDDLNLREVNLGFDQIYDLSYYNSTEFMSQGLYNAYNAWIRKYNASVMPYNSLLVQTAQLRDQLFELETKMPDDPDEHHDKWADPNENYTLAQIKEELKNYGWQAPYYDVDTGEYEDTSPLTDLLKEFETMATNRESNGDARAYTHTQKETYNTPPVQYIPDEILDNGDHYSIRRVPISGLTYNVTYDNFTYDKIKGLASSSDALKKKGIIGLINDQIATTKAQVLLLQNRIKNLKTQMDAITEDTSLPNNFTEEQLKELSSFIREDELSTTDYVVTDSESEESRLSTLKDFMDFAKKQLSEKSQPQLSFSASIVNLLNIPEFEVYTDDFDIGNYVHVSLRDDYFITAKIMNIVINFLDPTDIQLTFANITRKEQNVYTDLQDAINEATSAATSLNYEKSQWGSAFRVAASVNEVLNSGLLDAGKYIRGTTDTSEMVVDPRGIFVNTTKGDYKDSIFIGGGRILFSEDNWVTVREAIGRIRINQNEDSYKHSEESIFGVLADAVVAGYVMGSTIKGNTIIGGTLQSANFTSGGTLGTFHNLENGTFIYYSKNQVALQLDADGNLTVRGTIYASGGSIAGFTITNSSIYNNKTSISDNKAGVYIGTDGISLGAGNTFKVTNSGALSASSVSITGGSIKIGDNFNVDTNGNLTAKGNASFSGNITATTGKIGGWTIDGNILKSKAIIDSMTGEEQIISLDGDNSVIYFSTASIYGRGNSRQNHLFLDADNISLNANTSIKTLTTTDAYITKISSGSTYTTFASKALFNNTVDTYSNVNFHNNSVWFENKIDASGGIHIAYPYLVEFDSGTSDYVGFWGHSANTIAVSSNMTTLNDTGKFRANVTNTSDIRYKRIIDEDMDYALEFIMNLKPFTFEWDNYGDDTEYHMGFGAQQIESILSSLKLYNYGVVDIPDNPERTWGISYSELIAPLVKVVQEQQKTIDELKAKIERIENA